MPDTFQESYEAMIKILQDAHDLLQTIPDNDTKNVKSRIAMNIQRDLSALRVAAPKAATTGIHIPTGVNKPATLKSSFGYDLTSKKNPIAERYPSNERLGERQNEKLTKDIAQATSLDADGQRFNALITGLYREFPKMENDQILDKFSEIEILAIARKAELPVNERDTKVDAKLVKEIKAAMQKIDEREKKKKEEEEKLARNQGRGDETETVVDTKVTLATAKVESVKK